MGTPELQAPKRLHGYITRSALDEFFHQKYDHRIAEHRASTLHGILLREVTFGRLDLMVRCERCYHGLNDPYCGTGSEPRDSSHRGKYDKLMAISVVSLKKMDVNRFVRRTHGAGAGVKEDLDLLLEYL